MKKAHRVKLKKSKKSEVLMQFNKELSILISTMTIDEMSAEKIELTIFNRATFSDKHGERIRIQCKIDLLNAWENAGRNTVFSTETIGELIYKKYQLAKTEPAEEYLKRTHPEWLKIDDDLNGLKATGAFMEEATELSAEQTDYAKHIFNEHMKHGLGVKNPII